MRGSTPHSPRHPEYPLSLKAVSPPIAEAKFSPSVTELENNMTSPANETQPTRDEMEKLAINAPPFPNPSLQEGAAVTNKRLAAGLDRVRGEALQRAKTAHTRLRKWAIAATALGFGIGVSLGYFGSIRYMANTRRH